MTNSPSFEDARPWARRGTYICLSVLAVVAAAPIVFAASSSTARAKARSTTPTVVAGPPGAASDVPTRDGVATSLAPRADAARLVSPSAKDVDQGKAFTFSPDTDPTCTSDSPLADLVKDNGYKVDQLIRSAENVTDEEEEKIGDEAMREMKRMRRFRNKLDTAAMEKDRKYIVDVAAPLLAQVERKGITYTFHTIEDDEPNAFAIPGGDIFVNRGLLDSGRIQNEAQLAGILAHEINHVDRRHTIAEFEYAKRLGGLGDNPMADGIIAMARHPFSSNQEDESDEYAVHFMFEAEYSPKQFVDLWQSWAQSEREPSEGGLLGGNVDAFFRTHPPSARRACHAMRLIVAKDTPAQARFTVGTKNFEQRRARSEIQY